MENQRINGPHDFIDNILYGYVCALCNYVQLSKRNVFTHLENEHQQLINDEQNIIEIILLKSTQPIADLLCDDKNDKALVEAKERISIIHQPNRYQDFAPVVISDGDDEDIQECSINHEKTIDLTLSDDDI